MGSSPVCLPSDTRTEPTPRSRHGGIPHVSIAADSDEQDVQAGELPQDLPRGPKRQADARLRGGLSPRGLPLRTVAARPPRQGGLPRRWILGRFGELPREVEQDRLEPARVAATELRGRGVYLQAEGPFPGMRDRRHGSSTCSALATVATDPSPGTAQADPIMGREKGKRSTGTIGPNPMSDYLHPHRGAEAWIRRAAPALDCEKISQLARVVGRIVTRARVRAAS